MTALSAFWRLLGEAPRGRLLLLFVLMVLASLSEGIGLLLLVPLLEILDGIKLTKILGQEGRHLEQFRQTLVRVRVQQIGFAASTSLSRAFFQVAGAALLAGYLYLGLAVWQTPVPELLTLVLIFSRVIPLFMSAQQQLHHWLHALPALEETERLLADCRAAAEPVADAVVQPWPVREALELDGVSLTYAERDCPALVWQPLSMPIRCWCWRPGGWRRTGPGPASGRS